MAIFEFLNKDDETLLEECEVKTHRGSGPGGRKADSSSSAVELHHPETDIRVRSARERSQHDNRRHALKQLRRRYALEKRHRVKLDSVNWPSSLEQYVQNGLRIKSGNSHFPFVVKVVLDVLESAEGRLSDAGDSLSVSTNQLTRFCKDHREVLERANQIRDRYGHGAIQ
jgi:hypothetical protein